MTESLNEKNEGETAEIETASHHTGPLTMNYQLSTINNKPSTTNGNMEVHHHPQLQHKTKPWKEYLLEGLMIFLAVTLGFFAENFGEHITESSRENEFAKVLYAELKDDSATAANKLASRLEKEKEMDYLSSFFKDSSLTNLPKRVYPAFAISFYLINNYSFEPKDGILGHSGTQVPNGILKVLNCKSCSAISRLI